MPYTRPTITSSGTTYLQFQASGFPGLVENVITANTGAGANLTQTQTNLIRGYMRNEGGGSTERLKTLMDSWTQQLPIASADLAQRILDHDTAFLVIEQAIYEAGVLQAANPGTLSTYTDGAGMPVPYRIL